MAASKLAIRGISILNTLSRLRVPNATTRMTLKMTQMEMMTVLLLIRLTVYLRASEEKDAQSKVRMSKHGIFSTRTVKLSMAGELRIFAVLRGQFLLDLHCKVRCSTAGLKE